MQITCKIIIVNKSIVRVNCKYIPFIINTYSNEAVCLQLPKRKKKLFLGGKGKLFAKQK